MATGHYNGDVRSTLALSQLEALQGTTRTLMLPGGRSVTVSIPAGTQNGQEIRLEGQGEHTSSGTIGALILTIMLTPTENFGAYPSPPTDMNEQTVFSTPPPPPPPLAQHSYPGATAYSSYPQQGQPGQPAYVGQQAAYAPYTPYAAPPAYGQVPLAPKPRRRSSTRIVLLVLLAFLIIGAASSIYFYTAVYQPQQRYAQATATVQTRLTGTAQAYASATAQVEATTQAQINATATVQTQRSLQATATVTALQTSYTQIIAGTPTLADSLMNPSTNNWDTGQECSFSNGAYHAKETKAGFFVYCVAEATNFSNLAYQVQMKIMSGDYGGLIFRADGANSKFYLFRIKQDGSYDLYVYIDNTGTHAKTLTSGVASNMNTGLNQTNKIGILARGNSISLYINGTIQDSIDDGTLHAGQIGVIADNSNATADVAYSGAQVWKL